ncbi:sulfur carrier protein ThiS [Clostridium sp. 19966]|uniref:sulfur carrier protein ThiS n=1 Tax=Clostridium sp. 19966 TaxID=2768166 RepID=UPI0028E08697|nr:sulfur carrier protein ThiS [Clostridium sp. 19966]MDT8718926.1 sulfur carrier protein ThiS [Clostridium sp. 19966]
MIINGEKANYEEGITVSELLTKLKLQSDKVVVEVDREIIAKNKYADKRLTTSSQVELIRFVGGG